MTTELRGLPLLDAAIAHIEANPQTWNQGHWRCGSGMCLAGWVSTLAGGSWVGPPDAKFSGWLAAEPGEDAHVVDAGSGPMIHVVYRAERLLGFSNWLSDALSDRTDERDLFSACNGLDDIKGMRDDLRAAAIDRAEEEVRP